MTFAFITLLLVFVFLFFLAKKNTFDKKRFYLFVALISLIFTISICIAKPVMHNRISLNIIDYLIKFNNDGSMTTTQRITTEKFYEVNK